MKKRYKLFLLVTLGLLVTTGCASKKTTSETINSIPKEDKELTLYLVRHGKTMLNSSERVQGWSDAVLTKQGEDVVKQTGKGLSSVDFQNAYSSDSGRAIQTANLILDENDSSKKMNVETDSRLREFNFGSFEGDLNANLGAAIAKQQGITEEEFAKNMTPEYFANSIAAVDKEVAKDDGNWPAEDYETITKRLTSAIDNIVETESSKDGSGNILIVSHGLSLSALLGTLFDDFTMPPGGLINASVSKVTYKNGQYTLESVNDTSFIK